jgi:spermidine synthase
MNLMETLEANNLNDYSYKFGTDKESHHSYISGFYESAFGKYQNKKINILEIGIYNGGSAALWSRYFTQATITAVDIVDHIHPSHRNLDQVTYLFGDAYRPNLFASDTKFDIIIDDGPHSPLSQIHFISYYLQHLNTDGIMVIEDVADITVFPILEFFVPKNYQSERVDLRHVKGREDDLMFIIRNCDGE